MKKEKKMSINSKLVINNENFLENVAIILKAMKIKYNKEVSEYLKNLTKNTVDNFCEKSNKKIYSIWQNVKICTTTSNKKKSYTRQQNHRQHNNLSVY